jgi:hypothetical protein
MLPLSQHSQLLLPHTCWVTKPLQASSNALIARFSTPQENPNSLAGGASHLKACE